MLRCSSDDRQRGLVGRGARLDVELQLCEPVTRFFERQDVLLRVDRADQIVGGRVELAAAHVVARGQQRHLVLGGLNGAVGLHLHDLLLGLRQFRFRLPERELLVGGIDLEDDVALPSPAVPVGTSLTRRSVPPADGAHQGRRPARTQFAGRVHGELQAARGRPGWSASSEVAIGQRRHGRHERRADDRRRPRPSADPEKRAPLHEALRI